MHKWRSKIPLQKWKNELDLHLDLNTDEIKKVESLFQKCHSLPVGGRGQRIVDPTPPRSPVKYPLMKEKDILEIISLYLVQKQLRIAAFDDMKMLKELFAKAQSCPELSCDGSLLTRRTRSQPDVSLSEENLFILEQQYNYIDFLRTLDEKECFVIVQHIPLHEVKNIEALVTSFGEIMYFRDSISINTNEKIVLVKMKTASECSWVVSCLDGHAWGDKVLSAANVADIFEGDGNFSESTSSFEEQFEDCISGKNVSFRLSAPVLCKSKSNPDSCHVVENEFSLSQYLDLPSSPAENTRHSAIL